MNENKKKIEQLNEKIKPLIKEINRLEREEITLVQRPRLTKLVGYCLRSTYEPRNYYGRILDLIFDRDDYPYFILEVIQLNEQGNPYFHLDTVSPYLNKEWWDKEVPMAGWERCTDEEYFEYKGKVLSELSSQKMLRKWILSRK